MLKNEHADILAWMTSKDIYYSPYKFVMQAYSWGDGDLKHFKGPREWQKTIMLEMEDYLRSAIGAKQMFGMLPDFYRHAIASGRGPGKSALVGMLAHWFLSTRIGGSVWVAANGEPQLRTKTFPEISKWVARGINSEFFELNSLSVQPATWFRNYIESPQGLNRSTRYYYISGQLWSKENPDAFAGAHNWDGEFAIFDEASGIPDEIWPVQEGVFTEDIPDRFWLAFSNPRVSQGGFFECFNKNRNLWRTTQIDSRTVEGISKTTYDNIIAQYGEDSDQARVEVYGQFPKSGEDQFISPFMVDEATKRKAYEDPTAPTILGVDPARSGLDSTVIVVRKGRDLHKILRYRGEDTMEVVGRVIDAIEEFDPVMTVIDSGGLGAGVFDRLKEQRYNVREVNFGWKSSNPTAFLNARAEIWSKMRDWLKTASIPADKDLKQDLTAPNKKMNSMGALQLEGKKEMRARGAASPDCFVSGTLVSTNIGDVPIENIKIGDMVRTPFGFSPVIKTHETIAKQVTIARFSNGKQLIGKGSHRVFTFDKGWVRLDTLALTNEIESNNLWSLLKWKFLTASYTRAKHSSFKHQVDTISLGGRTCRSDYFTGEFTSNYLGRFLKGITSITKTAIGLITPQKTSNAYLVVTTNGNTLLKGWQSQNTEKEQYSLYVTLPTKLPNGTPHQKDCVGTVKTGNEHGKIENLLKQLALGAESNTTRSLNPGVCSAQTTVCKTPRITGIKQALERALFAVKNLLTTSIGSSRVVPVSVEALTGGEVKTYNLTLLEDNAYYANGILVENCADALALTFYYPVANRENSRKAMIEKVRMRSVNSLLNSTKAGAWMA